RFEASMTYDAKGNLSGLYDASLVRMTDTDGDFLSGKSSSDAESLAWDNNGGVIAAFEREHRLLRYEAGRVKAEIIPPPPEIFLAPRNGGIESLTRLNDGRLVAISEALQTKGGVFGWIKAEKGWSRFIYETDGPFAPKGAATLPGGDVLVLERFYANKDHQGVKIMRLGPSAFVPGAIIKGTPVASLRPPLSIDNFEGIAVAKGKRGETLIYLISDDNFSSNQRTLLMMFELIGKPPSGRKAF
ncbi:MAG TPA: esterase-like activity of phytase family protein, partial [Rhodospirillales bacterium]|nr:esterase-like activity of phytase family protein [Rhodospirillales bacterium]